MRLPAPMVLLLLFAPIPGEAADGGAIGLERRAYGRAVAESWCASCHVIGPDQRTAPGDGAPPFAAIARRPATTEMSLRAFLRTPHDRMPDWQLSQPELDGVIAHILSLRGP